MIDKLREHLDAHGVDGDRKELVLLISNAWGELHGSSANAMATHKLSRIEKPTWVAPHLGFTIERHGGTVMGSTRAELEHWDVDLDARTAVPSERVGYRQLHPAAARLDVKPLAEDVFRSMRERREDERLKWVDDGSVRVVIAKVVPDAGFRQTVDGRRKRFRNALEELVVQAGGERVSGYTYHLPGHGESGPLMLTPDTPLATSRRREGGAS